MRKSEVQAGEAGDILLPLEVSRKLHVADQTLRCWRSRGVGPKWLKLGTGRSCRVVYRRVEVDAWLKANEHGN
jgi:hypothetical protein